MPGRNVLIVTEAFLMGGLETRLNGEIEYLTSRGDEVHLAAGHLQRENVTPACRSVAEIDVDYLDDVSRLSRGVDQLTTLIAHLRPTHVLIQPFRSLLTGAVACFRTGTPYSFVIHGPASYEVPEFGPTYNQLTFESIRHSGLIAVSNKLGKLAPANKRRPIIVGNAVNPPSKIRPLVGTDSRGDWLIVSRLDEEKGELLLGALPWICEVAASVTVIGDGAARADAERFCHEHQLNVTFEGTVPNSVERMADFDVVAGMARVVLEALATQVHACLIGYKGIQGFIDTPAAFEFGLQDNFSGCNMPKITHDEFISQLNVSADQLRVMSEKVSEQRRNHYGALDRALEAMAKPATELSRLSTFAEQTKDLSQPLDHPDVQRLAAPAVASPWAILHRVDRMLRLASYSN